MKILHKLDKITIRTVTKSDEDVYLKFESENSTILAPLFRMRKEYGISAVKDVFNTLCQDSCLFCAIVDNEENIIVGFCQIEGLEKEEQTVGITIDKNYRGKGYGYLGAKALMEFGWELLNSEYFVWETTLNNIASRRLAEKLGGKVIGERDLFNIDLSRLKLGDAELFKSPQVVRYKIERP